MKIKEWFMNILKNTRCRDPRSNQGQFVILRTDFLKKNKNLKKYNVIVYGDTVEELHKNYKILEQNIYMMYDCPDWEGVN